MTSRYSKNDALRVHDQTLKSQEGQGSVAMLESLLFQHTRQVNEAILGSQAYAITEYLWRASHNGKGREVIHVNHT